MIMAPSGDISNPQLKEHQNGDHKWICGGRTDQNLINFFLNLGFVKYDVSEVLAVSVFRV